MTSQSLSVQQKAKFKRFFHRYIYGQSATYELLDAFDSIPNFNEKLKQLGSLQTRKHSNLTAKEQMYMNSQRFVDVYRLSKQANNPQLIFRDPDWVAQIYGFSLNTNAFLVTIQLLGNQQQVNHWRQLVLNGKVIGGYGQTQLGHGSNVQMLETQALYNEQRDTFILNSPKVTSVKFWPGCFGTFSTHCVLQAKTIVKGKKIGVQTFILPMRDIYLNPLPGIESGDIGPKIGFLKVDNGFLKINNVQIPRQNMLAKYIQIQKDGQVKGLQNKQAIKYGYGSMLNLRVKLVVGFALAYTYSPAVIQLQILEQSDAMNEAFTKKKVIQTMCIGVGTILSNNYVTKIFKQFLASLKVQNYSQADKLLINSHIISSTFKALSSWRAQSTMRQFTTLNQFGTFQSTYLPKYFTDCIPSVTYQGDNTVLLQQTAKFILVKEQDNQLVKPNLQVDANDLNQILAVMKFISSSEIRKLKGLIQVSVQSGQDFKTVWNQIYQRRIIQVSTLWGKMMFVRTCIDTLKTINTYQGFFNKIAQVFSSVLLKQTTESIFYGFKIKQCTAYQEITIDQIDILRDLNRPLKRQYQRLAYQTRGNKDVSDWIYSKL